MSNHRGRFVVDYTSRGGDTFQQFQLAAAQQTATDAIQVRPKFTDTADPVLLDAQVQSINFIGLGDPGLVTQVDLAQQSFGTRVKPVWPAGRVDQICLPAHCRIVGAGMSGRQSHQPLWVNIYVIVEKCYDFVPGFADGAIPGVIQSLSQFPYPPHAAREF